jgi:hypothetical protein
MRIVLPDDPPLTLHPAGAEYATVPPSIRITHTDTAETWDA